MLNNGKHLQPIYKFIISKASKKLKELNCEVAILDRMFLSNTYTKPLSVKFENPAVTKKIFHGLLTHAFLE